MPRLHLGPRMRKVVFYASMVVLALVTFVFAVQATFPYHRVKAKIEELAGAKVDLTINEIDRGIMPGVFYLKGVSVKTRPKQEDLEKAYAVAEPKERDKAIAQLSTTLFIESLKVDIGLLGFLKGNASVDFDASFGSGSIHGTLAVSKDGTTMHIVGVDVPSQQLPMREVLSNLPMSGTIEFDLDMDLPNEKLKNGKTGPNWQKAVGELEFQCPSGCTIGDGRSKLKLKAKNARSQAFAGEGTDFGKIQIQSLLAKLEIKDGKVDLTKFETKSNDVELHVEYTMTLQQDINDSVVLGCLRFKGTDALRKREPKTFDQIALTGAARHTDGLDHIHLKGTFKDMRKLPEVCGPGVSAQGADDPSPSKSSRPNLTVHPDDPPVKPAATMPTPMPPMPSAPADAGVFIPHFDAANGSGAGSGAAVGSGSGSAAAVGSDGAMGSAGMDPGGSGSAVPHDR
ncbi:MAG: type II secretion system protein GspN [Kofleriaceae bacterium]